MFQGAWNSLALALLHPAALTKDASQSVIKSGTLKLGLALLEVTFFKTLTNLDGSVFRSQTWIPEEGDFQNSSLALIKYSGIYEVFWSEHSK